MRFSSGPECRAPEEVQLGVYGTVVPPLNAPPVDKVDLLLMIDNSGSMIDKQEILRLAIPDSLEQLAFPRCLDTAGFPEPAADGREGDCSEGFEREFLAIKDINIAVISSSLGDAGANNSCPTGEGYETADMAHTIGSLSRGAALDTNSPELGFLQWRPGTDFTRLAATVTGMVEAVGQKGCGWEASLESWYRFLVDRYPYQELVRVPCTVDDQNDLCVEPRVDDNNQIVVDEALLAQRRAFLRPDSALVIVMLTDENDCSIRTDRQSWVVAANNRGPMYRATSICDKNPNDKCCHVCAVAAPDGCSEDPICDGALDRSPYAGRLSYSEDSLNLRCFQQKRRFGMDFLYPTSRYINALTQERLCRTANDLAVKGCPVQELVANPLFSADGRRPGQVIFGGIIGVPYQSVASTRNATGELLPGQGDSRPLRFKSWQELSDSNDWDKILGDVGTPYDRKRPGQTGQPPQAPTNAYMVESEYERAGVGEGNEVNGRDWDTTGYQSVDRPVAPRDDLQYACIFPLVEPYDCTDPAESCDCSEGFNDKPLCEEEPGVSVAGTTQYWAKAYPGTRHLEVLKGYGENAIVASICASNLSDKERPDYGYRPAMAAIVERLKLQLETELTVVEEL